MLEAMGDMKWGGGRKKRNIVKINKTVTIYNT